MDRTSGMQIMPCVCDPYPSQALYFRINMVLGPNKRNGPDADSGPSINLAAHNYDVTLYSWARAIDVVFLVACRYTKN